jgi:hypothetical protein
VAKAIYGSFKDAELINDPSIGQIWILPCTQEVNITLKFGGKAYPVHPLDAAMCVLASSARVSADHVPSAIR